MPLCIINVDKFRFYVPKISWVGTDESIVHTTGERHTISLNTIYDDDVSKTLQKFNGTDWVDVADIDTDYTIDYDGVSTDKYRLKATILQKVLYSNELTIVNIFVPPIEFDGEGTWSNVCIKFTKDVPKNVRSYTLVVVSGDQTQRFPNKKCFHDDNAITGVYVEYEYETGYKADSNTLKIDRPKSLDITWQGGGTENKEGYVSYVGVHTSQKNVTWEIHGDSGQLIDTWFSGDRIDLNIHVPEGVNKIRAILKRYNLISNTLVYKRRRIIPLIIAWDNDKIDQVCVNNGTNLVIKLYQGETDLPIKSKIMQVYIDGNESLANVDDLSNMRYVSQGDKMQFRLKIIYNDGTQLESNILDAYKLKMPKITWWDKTDRFITGTYNVIEVTSGDLSPCYAYKYQVWFRENENDTNEKWEYIPYGYSVEPEYILPINIIEIGWYKIRVVSIDNSQLVSNVLELHNVPRIRRGTISWKGTTDKVIYNNSTPIVVNADPPEQGGSYSITVNTYIRNNQYNYYGELAYDLETYQDRSSRIFHNSLIGKIGQLKNQRSSTIFASSIGSAVAAPQGRLENDNQPQGTTYVPGRGYVYLDRNAINYNKFVDRVNNISELDVRTSQYVDITYGLHYFSLEYTNRNGEIYKVGEPIVAIIRDNTLTISEYVYEDEWGIIKQTADHNQTRYEVKNSWSNKKSRMFIDQTRNVDDQVITHSINHVSGLDYKPKKTLQKQRLNETQWTDVDNIDLRESSFTKEQGIVKYRLKHQLHNGDIEYSNEVYTFNVGDILKFDTDKYYIVENVFNKNDEGKYNKIENQHELSATLLDTFTYQYQISINGYDFENVGNTFNMNDPLTFNDIFTGGYPNGIVLIRLECKTTLDKQIRYSNLIYAMFNGATLRWKEDDNDSVTENILLGEPGYTFSVEDIYKFKIPVIDRDVKENNGELKIYVNKTDPQQKTYKQIIDQNVVIETQAQAEDFTKSIDPNVEERITHSFTFSWVNSFGITHKGKSVITATWIKPEISVSADNRIRIPYEVKTTYRNAADIYYYYQYPTVVVHRHVNNPNIVYTLERANLNSEDFTQEFVLPNRQNGDTEGDYVIDRKLTQGKYRIKLTVNNSKEIRSDIVTLYTFNDILKVNNTYAVFGFNNTVRTSGYDNQTQYNITYNLQAYPDTFRFKVQWSFSSRNILSGDRVTTQAGKKVMSMNSFVDIGAEFSKTDTVDIKNLIGRRNGLVRIRLKALDDGNIVGYSNIIWIYLDDSISYFVLATVDRERTTFPLYVEGDAANRRLERLVSSNVFAIRCRHMYPDQRSDIYILTWNGRDTNNKYRKLLFRLTGNGANGDRNRTPNVYLYHRKTVIQPFNITLIPREEPLEQVVITSELINQKVFVQEPVLYGANLIGVVHNSSGYIQTSGVSSTTGNVRTVRYNNGLVDLPFEFVLYESQVDVEQWSKYSGDIIHNPNYFDDNGNMHIVPGIIKLNANGLKEYKFQYKSNRNIKNKVRIKYKNRYINETNAVSFYYFEPILSMDENRIGNDALSFVYTSTNTGTYDHPNVQTQNDVTVYANNTVPGYAYKFQIRKAIEPPGNIMITLPDGQTYPLRSSKGSRFIRNDGFQDYGDFFTGNTQITIHKENPNTERHKYYALRLAIYNHTRDILIGYSNVVYFENDDFFESD